MNFYELYTLIVENTVSQELKKAPKDFVSEITAKYKNLIKKEITNIKEESVFSLAKWMAYRKYIKDSLSIEGVAPIKDFLAYNIDNNGFFSQMFSSKLNNIKFSWGDLLQLNDSYHNNLKKGVVRLPGRHGDSLIEFPDGFKWVDIKSPNCELEAKSMGHCGNAGARTGDTILSLRDHKNIPYLTFILNNGKLGEMKGHGNDKPVKKYHKYIIELLKLPIIKTIVGGGYKPENNFSLSHLEEKDLLILLNTKPDLVSSEYEMTQLLLNSKNPKDLIAIIGRPTKVLSKDSLCDLVIKSLKPYEIIKALDLDKDKSFMEKFKNPDFLKLLRETDFPKKIVKRYGLNKIIDFLNYRLHNRMIDTYDAFNFIFSSKKTQELVESLGNSVVRKIIIKVKPEIIEKYLSNPSYDSLTRARRTTDNIKYQLSLLKNYLTQDQLNYRQKMVSSNQELLDYGIGHFNNYR